MPHVRIGDKTFEISQSGDAVNVDGVAVDGVAVDVSLQPLSGATYLMMLDGHPRVVTVEQNEENTTVTLNGTSIESHYRTDAEVTLEKLGITSGDAAAHREIRSPMPGLLLRMLVEPGETVSRGQGLVVLEAMKMENELSAPADGVIAAVHAEAGTSVAKNDLLVELD